jgi:hypothetical protein
MKGQLGGIGREDALDEALFEPGDLRTNEKRQVPGIHKDLETIKSVKREQEVLSCDSGVLVGVY